MKYLKIHKMIWLLICLIAVLFILIIFIIVNILNIIWEFKVIEWSDAVYYTKFEINEDFKWRTNVYTDKNPKETLLRFYHCFD